MDNRCLSLSASIQKTLQYFRNMALGVIYKLYISIVRFSVLFIKYYQYDKKKYVTNENQMYFCLSLISEAVVLE